MAGWRKKEDGGGDINKAWSNAIKHSKGGHRENLPALPQKAIFSDCPAGKHHRKDSTAPGH